MSISINSVPSKCLVVGGSFAGLCVTRHLINKGINVVLVEPKDYFEYAPGIPHLLSGSGSYEPLLSPLEKVVDKQVETIRGKFLGLSRFNQNEAIIQNINEENKTMNVKFDALVIATGVPYSFPIRPDISFGGNDSLSVKGRIQYLEAFRKRLQSIKGNIIINGGGLIGVELAAEIFHRIIRKQTDQNVIIISRSKLLRTLPNLASKLATEWFIKNGVTVLTNDEIASQEPLNEGFNVTTIQGRQLMAEFVIDCTGSKIPNKSNSFQNDDDTIFPWNKHGLISVDRNLRSQLFSDIGLFACGDVIEHDDGVSFACSSELFDSYSKYNIPPIRNAHLAESQAELVSYNVLNYLQWKKRNFQNNIKGPNFKVYPKDVFGVPCNPLLSAVSLGPRNGIVVVNNIVLGGLFWLTLGGLAKFIVERTKIAEIRYSLWGRCFWALAHVIINFVHCLLVQIDRFKEFIIALRYGKRDKQLIDFEFS